MAKLSGIGTISGFLKSLETYPGHVALEVEDHFMTYSQLFSIVGKLGNLIIKTDSSQDNLVGILAYRSLCTYSGILSTLAAGKGYVPLNPKFPVKRLISILKFSNSNIIIVGKEFYPVINEVLTQISYPVSVVIPDVCRNEYELAFMNRHCYFFKNDIENETSDIQFREIDLRKPAYVLFTSGTTGVPKGIPISHFNLASYIKFICDKYDFNQNDRCSQAFDTTFDPSVHDMFITWNVGAALISVPEKELIAPASFIISKKITVWYSVPSIAMFMMRMRILKPGIFKNLRYSIFSGEALSIDLVELWMKAAPDSKVVNYYGPTEVTINITDYVWEHEKLSYNGIVSIGKVFNNHNYRIVDENLHPVPVGEIGELIISGDQVCYGYINNPDKNKECFVNIENRTYYKTGDLVKEHPDRNILYLGRLDHQVKIRGYRVELGEIEQSVKNFTNANAIAIAYPVQNNVAEGIVIFIEHSEYMDESAIRDHCSKSLPEYMIPKKYIFVNNFPLSINGKIDRKKLIEIITEYESS